MSKEYCITEMNEASQLAQQYLGKHRELRAQMDYQPNEERLKIARGLREMYALYKEQLLRYHNAQNGYTTAGN